MIDDIAKILKPLRDNGYHDNNGARVDCTSCKRLDNITDMLTDAVVHAYNKGHTDGAIAVVNNTCSICHAYPMTTNCNNANCDN